MTAKRTSVTIVLAIYALALSSCARLNSIFRTSDLSGTSAVFTDAKQRVVTSTEVSRAIFQGHVDPARVLCAEPSPDVAQAISESLSASLQAAGRGAAAFSQASAESIAQLGERLATIQLLRDKFYRACEAYANGAISATSYTIMLSRLDKTMATLMLGEMAAGAFGRTLASAGGSAQAKTIPPEDVDKLAKDVTQAKADVDAKQKDSDTKKEEAAKAQKAAADDKTNTEKAKAAESAQTAAEESQKKLQESKKALQQSIALLNQATSANATATPGANIGSIGRTAAPSDAVAQTMTILQSEFLQVDDLSTLIDSCVTSLDMVRNPTVEQLANYSSALNKSDQLAAQIAEERKKPQTTGTLSTVSRLSTQKTEADKVVQEAADKLPLSPLGKFCENVVLRNFDQLLVEQHKFHKAKTDVQFERARLDLCKAAVTSSNQKLQDAAAGACFKNP